MKEAVLLLSSIIITGILSCQDDVCMCLIWKVKKNSLVLTCKITNLLWAVSLYDPLNKEQGFCVPKIQDKNCHPIYKNVGIDQNTNTNETIFSITGRIDQRMNGNWTCTHGSYAESVTVEVALLNSQERKTRLDCWQLLLLCTISGFVLFYILSQLFIYIIFSPCTGSCSENSCLMTLGKKIWMGRRYMIERITDSCICLQKNKEFSMKAIKGTFVCLLLVLMVAIPVAVGFSEKGMCSENLSFIPIGFVFGFMVRMLLMDERGTEREKSFIKGCCCLSCICKEEEQTDPKEHDNFMDDEGEQRNIEIQQISGTESEKSFIYGCCCLSCKGKEEEQIDPMETEGEQQSNIEIQTDIGMVNVTGTSTESDT